MWNSFQHYSKVLSTLEEVGQIGNTEMTHGTPVSQFMVIDVPSRN